MKFLILAGAFFLAACGEETGEDFSIKVHFNSDTAVQLPADIEINDSTISGSVTTGENTTIGGSISSDGSTNIDASVAVETSPEPTPEPAIEPTSEPDAITGDINLTWTQPLTFDDDSPMNISDVAAYIIYSGTSEDNLSDRTRLVGNNLNNHVFEDVTAGDYYFAVAVETMTGSTSLPSNIVHKIVE